MKLKQKIILCISIFTVGLGLNLFFSSALHQILSRENDTLQLMDFQNCISSLVSNKQHLTLFLCLQGFILILSFMFFLTNSKPYQSELFLVTPDIATPIPVGQHQHDSSRWLTEKEKDSAFCNYLLDPHHREIRFLIEHGKDDLERKENQDIKPKNNDFQFPLCEGGVVLGMRKEDGIERIYYVNDDTHTLTIGATRSGKSRTIVLQSICTLALAGESLVMSDPKAELFHYTAPYLERLGYEVICLDFKNPEKSQRYNLLQPIIDAFKEKNMERAEMLAWDMTNILVGKPSGNGEKLWHNGEMSIIAAAILVVVFDNMKRPEYQNLTNVYWFIAEMTKTIGKKIPLIEYVKKLPANHPAKPLLSISDVAPARTRSSFYTSALTTLRLFTGKSIYSITSKTDFSLDELGKKKQALFIILPDEKTTFYPIASLLISLQYEMLVSMADKRGGRLEHRVNYLLDEFGNFTEIADFTNKLTVGGGRGMRFNLYLQDFEQLDAKYEKHASSTIKSNCQTWIYLQADEPETLKQMSEKLGSYTTSAYQLSASHGKYSTPSTSHSLSLMERKLLTSSEVRRVSRPYQIVTSRSHPAMMYSPDLLQWQFNKMLGMGDKEHNRKLREIRENARPIVSDFKEDIILWNIWIYYQKDIMRELAEEKRKAEMAGINDFE